MDREVIILYDFAKRPRDIPEFESQKSIVKIEPTTPKISFLSLDTLLQRQFYNYCPPILRRDLFLSSKSMKEIKCPTYVTNDTWIQNQNYSAYKNSGRGITLINCSLSVFSKT